MEFDYRKLCGRIVEKFGSRKAFAAAYGMKESTLSGKLNGKTSFSMDEMYRMRLPDFLDIPDSEFIDYFFTQKVR